MASYQTTVTLVAPASGNVLLPNGSTVVTISLDVTAQAAVAAALALQMSNYAAGSTMWLQQNAAAFSVAFATISATDSATGLPTAATVRWPDGTGGSFTGTIDSGGNGYSGYVVTWTGSTTKTVTVSGITYDVNGNPIGPTGLVVS